MSCRDLEIRSAVKESGVYNGSGTAIMSSTTFTRGSPLIIAILAVIALLVGGLGLAVTFRFINAGILGQIDLLQISRAFNGHNANQIGTGELTLSFRCSDLGLPSNQTVVERQQYHVKNEYKDSVNRIKSKHGGSSRSNGAACQSKYQQHCYRKNSGQGFYPPPLFLYELRSYEDYHARCTAGVNLTQAAMADHHHQAGNDTAAAAAPPAGCRYLVWKGMDGMGNHIVSLVSAFVYALLTRRVLLVATDTHVNDLFCNPFPSSSWALPPGFPEPSLRGSATRVFTYLEDALHRSHAGGDEGGIFRPCDLNLTAEYSLAPTRVQVYLTCCDGERDHQFFCPAAQRLLAGVPWIFFHSHEYSIPGLYFLPDFRQKLNDWFPERDVFMHAARYLLNPENDLWGRITEQYRASHMAEAQSTMGIHVRAWKGEYDAAVDQQVLRCVREQKMLPDIEQVGGRPEDQKKPPSKVVVLASLRGEYAENMSREYAMKDGGNDVHVWSPSAEGQQKLAGEDLAHDQKAVADMWLLSFTHELVITPFSTFGSCASGLAGVVPLVFTYFGADKLDFPACLRTNLAGPCFIKHPRHQPCHLDPPSSSIFDPLSMLPDTIASCHLNYGLSVYTSKS